MQRSSWQMLQSNLVWQAGHPLIQQIQSHINVTRKESAGRFTVDVISSLMGEVQGRLREWCRQGQRLRYLGPKLFIESTSDEASFKQNNHALWSPIFDLKVQVLPPVVQLGLL